MNYIGSKLSLLEFIDESLTSLVGESLHDNMMLCDIFAGTNVVGSYFKNKGYSVVSNDIQTFGFYLGKVLIENNELLNFEKLNQIGIDNPFNYLNKLKGRQGFIFKNYTLEGTKNQEYQRQYFTEENAKKIDAIRLKINYWNKNGLLSDKEYYYLVASLVESADKIANTASVYEAFLKKIKSSAQKELILKPLDLNVQNGKNTYFACNEDGEKLIKHIHGDVLYMDPPYNNRKYDTNYHILETIALYDNPKIKGKTGVRCEQSKKSNFCIKKLAPQSLENIVKDANFKYILLSYNNEGIIPIEKIEEIFSRYGKYSRFEKNHRRFKADNSREYSTDHTIEYIHCLVKEN